MVHARDAAVSQQGLKADINDDAPMNWRAGGRAPAAAQGRRFLRCGGALIRERHYNARVGAISAVGSVGAPVRRDGGRLPARAQGRRQQIGQARAPAACSAHRSWRLTPTAQRDFAGEDPLLLTPLTCRWCGRYIASRPDPVQAQCLLRLHPHRHQRQDLAHGHRGAQHGHSRGRYARGLTS